MIYSIYDCYLYIYMYMYMYIYMYMYMYMYTNIFPGRYDTVFVVITNIKKIIHCYFLDCRISQKSRKYLYIIIHHINIDPGR
jgi:hypothetical protein